ncbi:DUF2723 domain-containing protein [Sphingobacterium sp. lm-10]|uniref:protein O-mannosyl-transferase family n=1 Tax=Sphingobacterium sp. lm-10 TaxID=2944904 RepID=UPI0020220FA7|nr:DUF2723 domain-containing protein [Sphingobacterium sp. lm-10]MCL7989413.1 DUF2723 domain-containing protein [Sphingobacterium sp. lm-10]
MNYNKWNNLTGWVCGLLATLVYIFTADRTTSWWDTGEFIASAYKLQIVHQPGAPLFLMIQNIFSNLAGGDVTRVAFWMNIGSAICSGFTIVFLCWTITALVRKVLIQRGSEPTHTQLLQIISAGAIGALAYAFTDTFWYSAVESEVYAMSSLCTAVVLWLAVKWMHRADQPDANRWLLLIAYVMGLSIGVHLLNLLTIPAIALLVYFQLSQKAHWKGVLKTLLIGVAVLGFILWGVIQYTVKLAAYVDLTFVNTFHLPFGSGIVFFFMLLATVLIYGLIVSKQRNKPIWNIAILGTCFVLFGYSSYTFLPVRAQTEIALNNNNPDDVFSLYGYITREQYPSEPLLKGPTYNANAIDVNEQTFYRKDPAQYTAISSGRSYQYDKEMLFPRVWSERHASYYQNYLGLADGQTPTQADNLSFFLGYQLNHMYWRYFMWNFVGRQNDTPNPMVSSFNGNWLSGITPIDEARLGGQQALDTFLKKDPSRNTYFFLPLLIGVAGLIWHFRKSKRDALVITLLFFFTGIAIVLYLNQSPLQPRERDYAYAGSFYMFSIWIGMGALAITEVLRKRMALRWAAGSAVVIGILAAPILLMVENWDDHDRSDRIMAKHMAYNYLESCAPNAILFTYTDNDTFPLWYLQEVEQIRRDVRVVNIGYLQSDWYLKQLVQDQADLKALPIDIEPQKIAKGVRDGLMFVDMQIDGHVDVKTLLDILLSDDRSNQVQMQSGTYANVLPTKNFQLAIDKDAVIANNVVPKAWEDSIPDQLEWTYNKNYVSRAELGLMSLLVNNNWERPVYFFSRMPEEHTMGLDKYLVSEGLVHRLMPVERGQSVEQPTLVNIDTLYENITKKLQWGNLNTLAHLDTDSRFIYENFLYPDVLHLALQELRQQHAMDKAGRVAAIAYRERPMQVHNLSQVYQNTLVIDTLYKTKQADEANTMLQQNLAFLAADMDYKAAVYVDKQEPDVRNIRLGMTTLAMYTEMLQDEKYPKLLAEVQALDEKYQRIFGQ